MNCTYFYCFYSGDETADGEGEVNGDTESNTADITTEDMTNPLGRNNNNNNLLKVYIHISISSF